MTTSKNIAAADFLTLGKSYRPAANTLNDTQTTWESVQALLSTGAVTRGELTNHLKEKHNHADFVGYAIRRGWLQAAD